MAKVALTLESEYISADTLKEVLEALRPALEIMTDATVHVVVQEEN